MYRPHSENHLISRIGWLRAAVLGANDGIISTASLMLGVASANVGTSEVLVAGIAGMVAGAMSMAAGEYVSVSSQADTEAADLARERRELADDPAAELAELAAIYTARGVSPELSLKVAKQLTARDALEAHARDELGISATISARPIQAALTSAATFAIGAALPVIAVVLTPATYVTVSVTVSSLACLTLLGGLGAWVGGAGILKPACRVAFWGAIAMGVTAGVGALVGRAV